MVVESRTAPIDLDFAGRAGSYFNKNDILFFGCCFKTWVTLCS